MAIFRVELGSSFIAGLVTILGYSINNTIVIFDRVRENSTINLGKLKPADIANKSVKDTFWRSVNTTFTTLSVIVCLAILCVSDVQIFALPIIVGLIAGAYSSMVIAPSLWALMQQAKLNKLKKAFKNKKRA
jgi:preprotein translocase SecF subunit